MLRGCNMSPVNAKADLERLGGTASHGGSGEVLESVNPATGLAQGRIRAATRAEYDQRVEAGLRRVEEGRMRPAPTRGQGGRRRGGLVRAFQEALRGLAVLGAGKNRAAGLGGGQGVDD